MKCILSLSLIFLALCSSALATQSITCNFADPSNRDKLVISLTNDQSGSFYYSLPGDSAPTDGKLSLRRVNLGDNALAGFTTNHDALQMTFKLPLSIIQKSATGVKATLTTYIDAIDTTQDQDLSCDSKI